MKKAIIYLVILLNYVGLYAQTAIVWSKKQAISTPETGNTGPLIRINDSDVSTVFWGNDNHLYLSKIENDIIGESILIDTYNQSPFVHEIEGPDIAVKDATVFLAYDGNNGVYVQRSTDGGLSFEAPQKVNTTYGYLPRIAITGDGNPLVSYIQSGGTYSYMVVNSENGGDTYNTPVQANGGASGDNVCECCTSSIASFGSTVMLMYRNNDKNIRDMWAAKSTNGGNSFEQMGDLDNTNWEIFGCPVSGPDGIINGTNLVSVWMSAGEGQSQVYISEMDISTMELTYSEQFLEQEVANTQNQPQIAGKNDTIGVVWEENFGNDENVYFAWSVSGTEGLTNNVEIVTNEEGTQYSADIAYNNGVFHIVYQDNEEGVVFYKKAEIKNVFETANNLFKNTNIQFYPNPTTNILNISNPQQLKISTIELYNNLGQLIKTSSFNQNQIDLTNMVGGTYWLKVEINGKAYFEKVVKF